MRRDDFVDDSALENALSDDDAFSSINLADHLAGIDTAPPQEVPPREGLYSTPLSWERPQPGIPMDSFIGLHSPSLNEAEQRRLIAIAMNPGSSMGGLGSNINLDFSGLSPGMPMTFGAGLGGSGLGQGPDPVSAAQYRPTPSGLGQQKRQDSISASDKGKEKQKPGDRTAHNDIERKYRTNLKDKIAELQDAVPALRTTSEDGGEDETTPSRTAKASKVCWDQGTHQGIRGDADRILGDRPHQSNRVHPLSRAAKPANRTRAPRALSTAPSFRTAPQRHGPAVLHHADLQQGLVRPERVLLAHLPRLIPPAPPISVSNFLWYIHTHILSDSSSFLGHSGHVYHITWHGNEKGVKK